MKIAIDVRTLINDLRTGVMSYTDNFVKALYRLDNKNIYYLLASGLRLKKEQINAPESEKFIKKILAIPDRGFWCKEFVFNNFAVSGIMKLNKVDIFHVPSGHNLPVFGKFKKVITIHDLRSVHLADDIMPQDISGLKQACKRADAVIAISEYTRKNIIEHLGASEKKVFTVYNGVDKTIYKLSENDKIKSFCKKNGINKKYFFSLGLVPRKNIKRLIEAYTRFKHKDEFILVLAGFGDVSEYIHLIEKNNIKENVVLLKNVSQEDLLYLYNGASFFVFPSLYEGFGLPALEAQKCGVPVLSSNASALPEVLSDSAVYFDPLSIDQMSLAMDTIIEDDSLRLELIEKGYANYKRFSWKFMAEQVLDIYKKIV